MDGRRCLLSSGVAAEIALAACLKGSLCTGSKHSFHHLFCPGPGGHTIMIVTGTGSRADDLNGGYLEANTAAMVSPSTTHSRHASPLSRGDGRPGVFWLPRSPAQGVIYKKPFPRVMIKSLTYRFVASVPEQSLSSDRAHDEPTGSRSSIEPATHLTSNKRIPRYGHKAMAPAASSQETDQPVGPEAAALPARISACLVAQLPRGAV